jgi:antitoxin (DNA-binding transcriptional repressor) of toxin-antitoxin stability system
MVTYPVPVKTLQVSKFKARCLGLLKEIRDTGEPLMLTLRGKTLAIIQPPSASEAPERETVSETLRRLRPLLLAEDGDLHRASASDPFPEDD